jgi:hypothetical protein
MTKLTRKERRLLRRQQRTEAASLVDSSLTQGERAAEALLQRERTSHPNSEGYHFVRPDWHRWVYGGGRKTEK